MKDVLFLLLMPAVPQAAPYEERVRPFLAAHCQECHGAEKPKGEFRLDQLDPSFAAKTAEERWKTVLEQIRSGAMPPPKKKARPPEDQVRAVTDWIGGRIAAAEAGRRASEGRVVLRRLNRAEYANTIRDLLEVDVDLQEVLALDSSMDGFDNVGSALHLSSFALERYLEAADKALAAAIVNKAAPPATKKRSSFKESHNVSNAQEPAFRVIDDTVVCLTSVHWQRVHVPHFWPPEGGYYRFRISASGYQSQGKPVSFEVKGGPHGTDYYDAPADTPTVFEFTVYKEARSSLSLLPYRLGQPKDVKAAGVDKYAGPGLALHWVEVEGPLNETWPPASHRRLFGDLPQAPLARNRGALETVSENPGPDAERVLRAFARRAFRRSVTDEELRPVFALVHAKLAEKESFERAVRVGLSALLMSRRFLFLDERPGKLDDFALAGRLSYFLWSSMPDEELLALAERKELGKPATLRAQVDRLLRSPKAEALAKNFCGQWLGLRDIDFTAPSHIVYPEFDDMLKLSMVREAELFFAELIRDDLSLLNFVASDFSMLNGRLAGHYGIPGVDGLWDFRKVKLPPDSHRGGVMTMAGVLKVTANGTTTSPITRGAWVLERLLGTPPPKPPANVPALEPDIRGATTIREQLAKHRSIESCAACHAQIDPPGFALESFDVIGGWRDSYRLSNWVRGAKEVKGQHYLQGTTVDPSSELADGRSFKDVDGLKQLLLKDKDLVARGLARRLTTYATGGAPEMADGAEIEGIVARAREKNYGLRTLIHEIVLSRLFREK